MKRYAFYLIIILFVPFTCLYGAPKYISIPIQVLMLPSKNLELADSLNIAIIANIYSDTRTDTLKMIDYPTDSLIAVNIAFDLKYKLEESPTFQNYDFPIYNFKRDDSKTTKTALPIGVVSELATDIDADYLFTIDIAYTDIWYEVGFNNWDNTRYAYTYIPFCIIFRYYDVNKQYIASSTMLQDTLTLSVILSNPSKDIYDALNYIMVGEEAVFKSCTVLTDRYIKYIVPHWVDEERYFINDGNKDMRKAAEHVEAQEWTEAMDIWAELTLLKNQKRAALACFNLALGCEIIGDFELAIKWLELAKEKDPDTNSYFYENIVKYEEILYKRLNYKQSLNKYFGI